MCVAADMRLCNVVARAILTKNGRTHIAAPARMRLVSHASLDVAWKPMTEIESLGSKKYAFIYYLTIYITLKI